MNQREFSQGVVESDEILSGFHWHYQSFVKRHLSDSPPTLVVASRARKFDQNSAHHPRRQGEEVRSILPVDLSHLDQPEIRFVNQRRRLQRVTRMFASHVPASDPA
jgi:hypothetical protein